MYYAWKITEYQSKQCTGKQTITPSENQEDQGRTGSILRQDLKSIGMTWEDAEQSAINREDWRRSVAQCDDLSLSKCVRAA